MPLLQGLVLGGVERAFAGESEQGEALAERPRPVARRLRAGVAPPSMFGIGPQPLCERRSILDREHQPFQRDRGLDALAEPRIKARAVLELSPAHADER